MLSISTFQLNAWLAAFLLPFARLLAFLSVDPILGNASIPRTVRIGLALLVTMVVAPLLPVPQLDPGSAAGLLALALQIVIGVSMGFCMRLVYVALEAAGELAGLEMGLGFATFFDPHNTPTPVIGAFTGLLATLVFFAVNAHLWLIDALVQSFRAVPVAATPLSPGGAILLVHWGSQLFVYTIKAALPVVAALLIVNLALGVMTRAAPQLNLFSVGFPITLAAGFIVLAAILPTLAPLFEQWFAEGIRMMLEVAAAWQGAAGGGHG